MSLTKLEENLNIIENLPDSPNLEPSELKRKFDQGSGLIKKYINETLTKEIDVLVTQIKKDVSDKITEEDKKKYYVGKLIFDTKNVNPATYLGFGVWKLWGSGRVPVGVNPNDTDFNEVEKTGGEKEHTLTIDEMPSHSHDGNYKYNGTHNISNIAISSGMSGQGLIATEEAGAKIYSPITGGGQAHNILQPYITCYIWKRVS